MPDTTRPADNSQPAAPRLKNSIGKATPNLNQNTREAFPGLPDATDDPKVHTVTINGVVYTWTAATADSVPAEAVAVYQRSQEANS